MMMNTAATEAELPIGCVSLNEAAGKGISSFPSNAVDEADFHSSMAQSQPHPSTISRALPLNELRKQPIVPRKTNVNEYFYPDDPG